MRSILILFAVLWFASMSEAAGRRFQHSHKPLKIKTIKDPVSRKHQPLPKNYVLKPVKREILGQKYSR